MKAVVLCYLWWNAIWDIKRREIEVLSTAVLCALICIRTVTFSWLESPFVLLLPAGLFVCFSFCSAGRVGLGDAIVLAVMGLLTESETVWFSLLFSLLTVSAAALVCITKDRKGLSIPFIPFLAVGYTVWLML